MPRTPKAPRDTTRTDGRHCPLCTRPLPRIAGSTRGARACASCGARPQPEKRCARCHEAAVWETGTRAACQACGTHGSRVRVVAGALED
jgi:hypothetical protein